MVATEDFAAARSQAPQLLRGFVEQNPRVACHRVPHGTPSLSEFLENMRVVGHSVFRTPHSLYCRDTSNSNGLRKTSRILLRTNAINHLQSISYRVIYE